MSDVDKRCSEYLMSIARLVLCADEHESGAADVMTKIGEDP